MIHFSVCMDNTANGSHMLLYCNGTTHVSKLVTTEDCLYHRRSAFPNQAVHLKQNSLTRIRLSMPVK